MRIPTAEPFSSSSGPRSVPGKSQSTGHVALGLYLSPPEVTKQTVLWALKLGYRHFDTAQYYENEIQLGEAIRESGIAREDVFLCTKILTPAGSVEKSLEKCRQSLRDIGVDYVDLFLIHSPTSGPEGRRELWEALVKLMEEGGARAIGVSNYGVMHMEEIKNYSSVIPAVNQIELHPWCQQESIVNYCEPEGIAIQAYSPLVRNTKASDPYLCDIATKHNTSTTKVLIRWSLQRGFIPLPKSDNMERLKENFNVWDFMLDDEDMAILNSLDQGLDGAVVPQYTKCA